MASWEGLVSTTITEHAREVEDNTLRNNKFLAKLRSLGRISYGHHGAGNSTNEDMDWRVKFAQGTLSGLDDAETLTFERNNRYKVARLPWRGYSMQEAMTLKEEWQNGGMEAIVKRMSQLGSNLIEEAEEQIHGEFFVDGGATGNSKRFHGIESCMAEAAGGVVGNTYMTPDDSYAGLATDPGDAGGSILEGTWPTGRVTSEYDYWSPKLVNWSSTGWGTASPSNTWALNAEVCLGSALIHSKAAKSKKGEVDTIFMNRELYRAFKDVFRAKEKIDVQRGSSSDSLVSMGFRDVINLDGVDVTEEYSVAANTFYGLNFNFIELCLLNPGKQLFHVEGPTKDIKSLAYLLAIVVFGNMKLNPRSMFKGKNYFSS